MKNLNLTIGCRGCGKQDWHKITCKIYGEEDWAKEFRKHFVCYRGWCCKSEEGIHWTSLIGPGDVMEWIRNNFVPKNRSNKK